MEIDDNNWENYRLLLERVFGLKKRNPFPSKTKEYHRWYYHNKIKTQEHWMERRRMKCQYWRLKDTKGLNVTGVASGLLAKRSDAQLASI